VGSVGDYNIQIKSFIHQPRKCGQEEVMEEDGEYMTHHLQKIQINIIIVIHYIFPRWLVDYSKSHDVGEFDTSL
jgi:hypothetical protein